MKGDAVKSIERAFRRALQESFFGIYGQLNLRSMMLYKKSFFELLLDDPQAAFEIVKGSIASEEGARFFFEEAVLKALALALGRPGLEKELAAKVIGGEREEAKKAIKRVLAEADP
jgi:hypothetical protein